MGLLLPCTFPTAHCCYTWGLELFGVAGVGQRLGPGGSRPRAQPPAGPYLAQTRQSGTAQSCAVHLNGLPVLSRKLSRPERWGEGESPPGPEPWLALLAVPPTPLLPRPTSACSHSGLAFFLWPFVLMSSLLLALRMASQVTFLSSKASLFYGVRCPSSIWAPPISLPLPSRPFPHLLLPALSIGDSAKILHSSPHPRPVAPSTTRV